MPQPLAIHSSVKTLRARPCQCRRFPPRDGLMPLMPLQRRHLDEHAGTTMTICWRRILQAQGAGEVDDLLEARVVEGMVVVDTPSPISGTLQPYRHPSSNGGGSLGGLCRLDCGCSSSGNGWGSPGKCRLGLGLWFQPHEGQPLYERGRLGCMARLGSRRRR